MKLKKAKIFLLSSSVLFSVLTATAVVSCEIKAPDTNSSETNPEEKKMIENELNKIDLTIEVKNNFGFGAPFPNDITTDSITFKGDVPRGTVVNITRITDRNNVAGTAKADVELTKNGVTVTRTFEIKGLSFHPFGSDADLNKMDSPIGILEYIKSNPLQRFEADNKVYVSNRQLRNPIELLQDQIKQYEDGKKELETERPKYDTSKSRIDVLNGIESKSEEETKELTKLTNYVERFENFEKRINDAIPTYEKWKEDLAVRLSQTGKVLKDAAIFDKNAAAVNQDSYENASRKGFTLPEYDASGKILGLKPREGEELGKGPSWLDDAADKEGTRIALGLARTLPSDFYKKIGLQTFSLDVHNTNAAGEGVLGAKGTVWIMDYQPTKDGSYPTKWYFGTNAHVSNLLKFANDPNYPTKANNDELTTRITLSRLTDRTPLKSTLRTLESDTTFDRWDFDLGRNQEAFKTVYSAYNYLKTSPKDYLAPDSIYKNSEEFIDFSIIEIDFSKLTPGSVPVFSAGTRISSGYPTSSELAKALTNDYADKKDDQIKFASTSYLKDYSKIQWPIQNNNSDPLYRKNKGKWVYDGLFALGYPRADEDGFLDRYADADQIRNRKSFATLWVNGKGGWYDKLGIDENTGKGFVSDEVLQRGNTISSTIGYRSFKDKPGITDIFITAPVTGDGIFKYDIKNPQNRKGSKLIDNFDVDNKVTPNFDNTYLNTGLNYVIRHYVPFGGSSGSSVRNQKNEILGALYVGNSSARASLILALRSEGFNYEGLYGNYNLEQYDLIYGGGKNQRTSYRQALASLYGKDFKTNLFPEGLDESKIPAKFRFSDKYLTAADTVNDFSGIDPETK